MAKNKVVSLPSALLPGLSSAATSSPGVKIDGSRCDVWLCQAYSSDGRGLMLYVKPHIGLNALLAECLAAQLGQCMDVPCPEPFIVTIKPQHVGLPQGPSLLGFGSAQVGANGLARLIKDREVLLQTIQQFKLTEKVCAFDEWIANPVRSPADILFCPGSGLAFIDHESALTADLDPSGAVTNWLADRVLEVLPENKQVDFLKALRARVSAAHRIDLNEIPVAVQFSQDGPATYRSLLHFLTTRLAQLDRLLSQRVLPQQRYIDESTVSMAHDPDRAADI